MSPGPVHGTSGEPEIGILSLVREQDDLTGIDPTTFRLTEV